MALGLYSFFNGYSQSCLGTENCQQRGFHIEQSSDIWIYNLCTKAIVEMVTPVGELITLAADNRNGFLSSILAWVRVSPDAVIGERNFTGFRVHKQGSKQLDKVSSTCATALTQTIKCHDSLSAWQTPSYHGAVGDRNLTDAICDAGCGKSLQNWFDGVSAACVGQNITSPSGARSLATKAGATIWAGYNETCIKDSTSDQYCNSESISC
jgi:hypothetical protein